MQKEKLFCSFSGGKSSSYMARRLQQEYGDQYDIIYIFANTGQEREQTLQFINRCSVEWGMQIVWVEAVVQTGRVGTTFRRVTFETASRGGEPFEKVIEKYGLPNQSYPHCTRELKLAPMYSYLDSIEWSDYKIAIGIRADESRRFRQDAERVGIIYPLAHWFSADKQDVNSWWEDQPFNLELKEHQGNCSWCWKKSLSKHFMLIDETPSIYEFPKRMELTHKLTNSKHGGRVMFRGNKTANDLFALRLEASGAIKIQDADSDGGCSESCDVGDIIRNNTGE